jgi:signal transduction histidine kinase
VVTEEHRRAFQAALNSTLELVDRSEDLLGTIAVEMAADRDGARRLIGLLTAEGDITRVALGREVLRSGRLLELGTDVSLEVALGLVLAFAGGEAISLWSPDEDGRLALARQIGDPLASGTTARFQTSQPPSSVVQIDGLAADDAAAHVLVMTSFPLLHRRPLAAPSDPTEAVARRLARLRFDLHDGPQQDVHLLAQDLGLFREQLRPVIAGATNEQRVLGRLDDLEAQLVALDDDLRRLATTVESPFLAPASLPDALRALTDAFAERTGVFPQTRLCGSVASLTDSQQIALLSLVREALSNIREHSDARMVQISIDAGSAGVEVEITDDGSGFDPESTRVRAARAGHLGLVGMHERVRMLGGSTQIHSRPGGPTVVSASLPAWSAD